MADLYEELQKKTFENIKNNLCSTYEGTTFMKKYVTERSTISDLEDKVISVIRDSNFSTAEAIGFMQYMKYVIVSRSVLLKTKEHE